MPPQQPTYSSPPSQYDFILQSHKRGPNEWLRHASMQTRIMMLAGGLLGLLILFIIFMNILGSSGNSSTDQLLTLLQRQTEIARISAAPARSASLQTTQDFATTTVLTMMSDERAFTSLLQRLGKTPDSKAIGARLNKATDTQLQAAQKDGTYDAAYLGIAQQQLLTYRSALQTAYKATSSKTIQANLAAAYTHATLLVDLSQKH